MTYWTTDDCELVEAAILIHGYNEAALCRMMRDECKWSLSKTREVYAAVCTQRGLARDGYKLAL